MDHVSYYIVLMKSKRITVSSIRTALNHAHSPFLMEVSSYKQRVVEDYLKKKYVKAAVLKTLLDTGACLPEEAVTDAMTIYLTNQRVKYNARAVIRVLDVLFEYGAILSNVGGNTHPLLYFT
ncbi:m148R [Myxoma virus]|uniref:M148R n=1 Tax=Myxoma virus TaxID=10273 RepID=A0A481NNY4_9POXV|nr:m148R [Myxoma virus]